jgi:hypothetical protein
VKVPLRRPTFGGRRRPSQRRTQIPGGSPISSDDIIRVEKHQIEQFVALGLNRYEAIRAVEAGIDCGAVTSLVAEQGCPVGIALQIAR